LLAAEHRHRERKGSTYTGVQIGLARIDAKAKVVDKVAGGAAKQAAITLIKRHRGVGVLKTAVDEIVRAVVSRQEAKLVLP
jgi:hypothetical protein